MTTYEIVDPFDIDNDELRDLTPVDAFILGVEYQHMLERLDATGDEFAVIIHSTNEARLVRLTQRHARTVAKRVHDGIWVTLTIAPRVPS